MMGVGQFIRKSSLLVVIATLLWIIYLSLGGKWLLLSALSIGLLVLHIALVLWNHYRMTTALAAPVNVAYSIVTGKPREFADNAARDHSRVLLNAGIGLEYIHEHFRITTTDWQYHRPAELEDLEWKDLVRDVGVHFSSLNKRIHSKARWHLFFVTPPAVALGVGATIGREMMYKVYQFFGPDHVPVLNQEDLGRGAYHSLNTRLMLYEEIEVDRREAPNAQDTAIILRFVGHSLSPIGDALDGAVYNEVSAKPKKYSGHLPREYQWMKLAGEVSSLILSEADRGHRVHLFFGLPTSLAFVVGTALGKHSPIVVYHHDRKREMYVRIFRLNELS